MIIDFSCGGTLGFTFHCFGTAFSDNGNDGEQWSRVQNPAGLVMFEGKPATQQIYETPAETQTL